jgi:catechol 2,3-dioxygenase-like lactoylglutathione lyase family enzyme
MRKQIQYRGINHLAMATRDMDRTIRFWRDFLGMRLVAGLGTRRYRHYFFEISENDMIAFFEWPEVEAIPEKDHGIPVKGPFAFDHVSIAVETDRDLWALRERFEAARMWISEIIDHGFIHSIYAFDPNNIPIEFSAPVAHVDIRKKPRMMDRRPSRIALEGPEPVRGLWPPTHGRADHIDKRVYPGEGRIFDDTPKGTE